MFNTAKPPDAFDISRPSYFTMTSSITSDDELSVNEVWKNIKSSSLVSITLGSPADYSSFLGLE